MDKSCILPPTQDIAIFTLFEKRRSLNWMKTIIVCSLNDRAGTNIRERLLENYSFKEAEFYFDENPVYCLGPELVLVSSVQDIVNVDNLSQQFQDCKFIFISRHVAESGIPSLTAHLAGNFGPAVFGGEPGEIANYSPSLLKNYLIELNSFRSDLDPAYNLTLEATHHGPTSLNSPVIFVELGSTEIQWIDLKASAVISHAIVRTIRSNRSFSKIAIGIGGTHYPEKLNRLEFNSDYALGPIIPKYALEHFSQELLEQILEKSDQKIETALVDAKGLGKFKENVFETLEDSGLEKVLI